MSLYYFQIGESLVNLEFFFSKSRKKINFLIKIAGFYPKLQQWVAKNIEGC
jgi:hypothetical protein